MFWNPGAEKTPVKELKDIQERKLRSLVNVAYDYSPFYRRKFKEMGISPDDIRSLNDLRRLPFTSKPDLRDNYPFGMFATPTSQIVRFHASSGTTGKPTVIGYTDNDIRVWVESLCRSLSACGVEREDIIQISYGYGLFTGGLGFHYAGEKLGATVIPTSAGNTQRQLELMKDLKSTVFACTPSYVLYLAEYANRVGNGIQEDTVLKRGIFGAEPWSEETRKRIEDKTGIDAFDVYGTSEMSGPLFTECTEKNGIHIWGDHFIPEVVDSEGEPVGDGEKGELVVTTISKEAMPLIRWKTGDVTILEEEKCACGRTHPRLMRILGRADDMLIVRGVNVFPSQIEHALMQIPEVGEHYMITLDREEDGMDVMTIQVEVKEEAFTGKVNDILNLEKKIANTLKTSLNVTSKVEIANPGTLQRFEGKAKRVIDNRKV